MAHEVQNIKDDIKHKDISHITHQKVQIESILVQVFIDTLKGEQLDKTRKGLKTCKQHNKPK